MVQKGYIMARPKEVIQREFNEAAIALGGKTFEAYAISEELEKNERAALKLKNKMLELTLENRALQAQESPSEAINAVLEENKETLEKLEDDKNEQN